MATRNSRPKKGDVWYEFVVLHGRECGWGRWRCEGVANGWYIWKLIRSGMGTTASAYYWGRMGKRRTHGYGGCGFYSSRMAALKGGIRGVFNQEQERLKAFQKVRKNSLKGLELGSDWIASLDEVNRMVDIVLAESHSLGYEQGFEDGR